MTFLLSLFKAISAIPAIKDMLQAAIGAYLAWLDAREVDRINKGARALRMAGTKEEKQKALEEWFNSAR